MNEANSQIEIMNSKIIQKSKPFNKTKCIIMDKLNNQTGINLVNKQKIIIMKNNKIRKEDFQKTECSPLKENENSKVILSLDEKHIKPSYILNSAHKECSLPPEVIMSMETNESQQNITGIKNLSGRCFKAKNDHEFSNSCVKEKSIEKPIGCSVLFVERLPSPHQLGIERDHCYTNNVSSQDRIENKEKTNREVVHVPNGVPPLVNHIPRSPYKMIVGHKNNCENHVGMFELKHEKLVKVGDTFFSTKELVTYLNRHAKDWLYCYKRYTSHVRHSQDFFTRCIFSEHKPSKSYKATGKRKRKPPHNYKCPCRIVMHRRGDDEHFTVTHVCNHHDHELTEKAFFEMPGHSRRLSPELKEEIDDLLSLGVFTGTIRKYVKSVTGFNFQSTHFLNFKKKVEMRNVERQFSIQKLKHLTDIIKEFEELPATDDKNSKSDEKSKTNDEENPIFSTLSTCAVEDKPTRKQSTKKRNAPKLKLEGTQLLENIENHSKNNSSQSRKRPKKIVEDKNINKKSRLETTLENLSSDRELLESVRQLQEGYITQPLNDKTSLIPTTTKSYATNIPSSGLLQQEQVTNNRSMVHEIFSADYFHENNDIHYDIMNTYHQSVIMDEIDQSEVIDDNVQTEVIDDNVQTESIDDIVQYEVLDDNIQTEVIDDIVQSVIIDENVVYYEDIETDNYIELHTKGKDYTNNDNTDQENKCIKNNSVYSNDVVNFQNESVYSNVLHNITLINDNADLNTLNQDMHQVNTKRVRSNNNDEIILEDINNTNQIKIQAKRNDDIEITNNQIIKESLPNFQHNGKTHDKTHNETHNVKTVTNDNSLNNGNNLNLKEKATQTNVEYINCDTQTSDELTNNELIHNSRAIIKDLKHLDNKIEYITKYNIDQYLIKENLHKHIENIASTMSMSVCNLLCNLYNGEAVIQMNVRYAESNKCITMSYLPETVPLKIFNHEEDNIVSKYKFELSAYYHALRAARDKIHEEEVEVKRLKYQIRSLENEVLTYHKNTAVPRSNQISNNYEGKHHHKSKSMQKIELNGNVKNIIRIDETLSYLELPPTSKVEREKIILKLSQQRKAESTNKINNEEPNKKKENAHEINDEMMHFPNIVTASKVGIHEAKIEREQLILNRNHQENTQSISKINIKEPNKKHENTNEINNEVTDLQNVLSDIRLKIQELKREEEHLTLIVDELSDKSSTIIQECLKKIEKSRSEYIPISELHVHKQKMFNFYLQELIFKNIIVLHILNNKVTVLQDEYESLVARNKALDDLVDRRKCENKAFIEQKNRYLEWWLKEKEQQAHANNLEEYKLKLTEKYIANVKNLTQKELELKNCIYGAEQELFTLKQTRDILKIEIDNLKKNKIRFIDRIYNATTITRLKCVQRKFKDFINTHEDVLRSVVEDLSPVSKDISYHKVNETTNDLSEDPLKVDVIKIEENDDEDNVNASRDTSSEKNQPLGKLLHILCRTFGSKNLDYRIVARKLKTDLLDEIIDNILCPN